MTVWKPKDRRTYRYRFFLYGQEYAGNTGQVTEGDAKEWEEGEQRRLRRQSGGLAVLPDHSPTFTMWAAVYLKHVADKGRVRRVDRIRELVRVVLRFWGARPAKGAIESEPYHDLRLIDPIRDPSWIVKFEQWLASRPVKRGSAGARTGATIGPQMRNHYRSIMSRMYRVAKLPQYQTSTGVTTNPFVDLERDRTRGRKVTVTPAQLRKWLAHTPKHAQLAIAIAALAPKLRLENVLSLRWDTSFDAKFQFITIHEHKTMDQTDAPMVVPIVQSLRTILKVALRGRTGPWVVMYRGGRVKSIRRAVQTGAERAGLTYGRDTGGVTFHTIRHTAATLLAEVPSLTEAQRAETMGQDILTTQGYTHLRPVQQRPVLTRLAARLKLDGIMAQAFQGPATRPAVPRSVRAKKALKIAGRRRAAKSA